MWRVSGKGWSPVETLVAIFSMSLSRRQNSWSHTEKGHCNQMVSVSCLETESQTVWWEERGDWVLHLNISSSWPAVDWASVHGLLVSLNSSPQTISRMFPGLWDLWVSGLELRKTHIGWSDVWWTLVLKCSNSGVRARAYWSLGFVAHLSFLVCVAGYKQRWHFKFWASNQTLLWRPLLYLLQGMMFSRLKPPDCLGISHWILAQFLEKTRPSF